MGINLRLDGTSNALIASAFGLVYRFCGFVQARGASSMELLLNASNFKSRAGSRRKGVIVCAVLGAAVLSGCNASKTFGDLTPGETITQGYVIDQAAIDPSRSAPAASRLSCRWAARRQPPPSTTRSFTTSRKRANAAPLSPPARLVDQRILAVYFGEDGRVSQIAHYGLKDGKVFDFVSRTTPTGGKDQSFIGQLLAGGTKANPLGGLPGA
jgi:outer membrane protein assembly factor BamE (lipoprotein component of BamABCDE complex)